MTTPRFVSHAEARVEGWFSRRHQTPDANREAREEYAQNRGREARRRRAAERKLSLSERGRIQSRLSSEVGAVGNGGLHVPRSESDEAT